MPKSKKSKRQKPGGMVEEFQEGGKQLTEESSPGESHGESESQHGGQNKIQLEPTKEILEKIRSYSAIGMTPTQVGHIFGMSYRTFMRRCKESPELAAAIAIGQSIGIRSVTSVLYDKCIRDENLTAIMFYLSRRGDWSEKQIHEIKTIALDEGEDSGTDWTVKVIEPNKPKEKKK